MKNTSKKEIKPFLLDGDGMKSEIEDHHFYKIYDSILNYGGQFIEDTRDGDYIRVGNMGLHEEKGVNWWKRHNGYWCRCGIKEKESLEKIAELKESLELAIEKHLINF